VPGAAEAIRMLNRAGVPVILATNQAGVARGYFAEGLVKDVMARLGDLLSLQGARLDAVYYCPHHPTAGEPPYRTACECRKPKPGMLHRGAEEFGLDLSRCYAVGDKISDVAFARAGGAKGIMVLTGYGLGEYQYQRDGWTVRPDWVGDDLFAAAEWILGQEGSGR